MFLKNQYRPLKTHIGRPLVLMLCWLFSENGTLPGNNSAGGVGGVSEAERKTQAYYLSCLNTQRIEELGSTPLIQLINKVSLTVVHDLFILIGYCDPTSPSLIGSDRRLEHHGALGQRELYGGPESGVRSIKISAVLQRQRQHRPQELQ